MPKIFLASDVNDTKKKEIFFNVYFKLYTNFFLLRCFLNGVIHSALFSLTIGRSENRLHEEHDDDMTNISRSKKSFSALLLVYLSKNHRNKF